ncbi:hypothetical protein [Pseudomonas entomophila]|uniref:hypothetical protein n=1 Tax=Pseudomonas entomophila TaxID=312306 RepID=UPI00200BF456|nr:hypothetical protein [Pseudomonas entomophila]
MSDKQKVLLAVVSSTSIDELVNNFSFSHASKEQLKDLNFQYVYFTGLLNGFGRDLKSGYLCKVKNITVSLVEGLWEYTFRLSEISSGINNSGELSKLVRKVGHWELFDWDVESCFSYNRSGVDDDYFLYLEPPSLANSLTIKEAIGRLAGTYGVDPAKVTVSITG